MFYRILNQVGTFLSPRTSPFGLRSALWLDLLSGGNPGEGSFLYSLQTQRTVIQALPVEGTEEEVFCFYEVA